MSLLLCGNRFSKGFIRPGGVLFTMDDEVRNILAERIIEIKPQVKRVLNLLFSTSSVRSRFEDCGTVSRSDAENLGLVGPAGRACGMPYDVRRCFPSEHYSELDIPENSERSGDVYARAKIRADETLQSMDLIQSLLNDPVETHCVGPQNLPMAPDSFVVTLNEAWRGEISHCVLTDTAGKIMRYKIKDPSFHKRKKSTYGSATAGARRSTKTPGASLSWPVPKPVPKMPLTRKNA
jgi:Ni,Fe-hydrogenase III large subunit